MQLHNWIDSFSVFVIHGNRYQSYLTRTRLCLNFRIQKSIQELFQAISLQSINRQIFSSIPLFPSFQFLICFHAKITILLLNMFCMCV